ncbi:MAG TPA: hypothetical protein VEW69_08480 [Alphaproteobacteria bacterium]|nr:hypothetical protein [Alphaproteobacteria bacterium]
MTLLDAQEYDPRPARRRNRLIATGVVVLFAGLVIWFFLRNWPEERAANKFFTAIEQKDFESAYGLYQGDPDWKKHPEKYPRYPFSQFYLDWGPAGDYGAITSHHVDCSIEPPKKDGHSSSGVIVVVTINQRKESKSIWVDKKTKSITDSFQRAECQ